MSYQEENLPTAVSAEQHLSIASMFNRFNRRSFLRGATATAAVTAGAGLMSRDAEAQAIPQSDVLNFALNLEYFEATLYSYLVNGTDIPASSTGNSGTVTNPPAKVVTTNTQLLDMMNEVYFDEISHVNDLRSALNGAAVARPNLDFSAITPTNYLTLARLIEDVGVTAYAGAAALLTSTNLQYAAQILAVEAFHAGAFRLFSIQLGAAYSGTTPDNYDIKPADPGSAAVAVQGPSIANGGFFATANTAKLNGSATAATTAQTNTASGMAYTRTTSQVLSIVYGSATAGTKAGGFFPAGLNGNIKTV